MVADSGTAALQLLASKIVICCGCVAQQVPGEPFVRLRPKKEELKRHIELLPIGPLRELKTRILQVQ